MLVRVIHYLLLLVLPLGLSLPFNWKVAKYMIGNHVANAELLGQNNMTIIIRKYKILAHSIVLINIF